MKLPFVENAVVPKNKITLYLLNLDSKNGKSKARFFLAFGFTIETWQIMVDALKHHAQTHDVQSVVPRPPFGTHYVIEGMLITPDGRNPQVRVIWSIDEYSIIPRLISAYPL
ncbi:MAG: hypothetical protein MUE54_08005 [Anaerolineae bacterium]|jgi:hypothetical protein|nr:hypothetical protein [Anaerolineae bacterium]